MKRVWVVMMFVVGVTGCIVSTSSTEGNSTDGYPGYWEQAELETDEFGANLIVVRQNGERWEIQSNSVCFWSRNYVGRTVLFKWGPVQSMLMNDQGQICSFNTVRKLSD